ncbi:uncharacterized protein LOC131226290 isoform X2 [Magnolia sinica]|uniref:uncharacterized protein LOC131226290 isoform X2 n=1 Tax=Magnolia sinica TaxID=86752 RepID=UPI002659125A|nr:uncharacterized protein LOC131226290 isoform X2 [Magnolia sinica]
MMISKCPSLKQWDSIPDDIALNIASFLQVSDICSLGSCSRFWRDLCASDFLWISLSKQRWPSLDFSKIGIVRDYDEESDQQSSLSAKVWRSFYINWHQVMAGRATAIVKFVKQSSRDESLEVGDFLRAIGELCSMEFGFKDVQLFLFTTKQNVLLNLIGLHYSLFWLGVPCSNIG